MSMRFRPLQAVEMLGRSKTREPQCPSDHCVYWWWKDRGDRGDGRQQTKTFGLALPCCQPSLRSRRMSPSRTCRMNAIPPTRSSSSPRATTGCMRPTRGSRGPSAMSIGETSRFRRCRLMQGRAPPNRRRPPRRGYSHCLHRWNSTSRTVCREPGRALCRRTPLGRALRRRGRVCGMVPARHLQPPLRRREQQRDFVHPWPGRVSARRTCEQQKRRP